MADTVHFEPVPGMDHRDKMVTTGAPKNPRFQSVCNCGARSPLFSVAGMTHGWHANHIQEVLNNNQGESK